MYKPVQDPTRVLNKKKSTLILTTDAELIRSLLKTENIFKALQQYLLLGLYYQS
jgi:hypothetical protein